VVKQNRSQFFPTASLDPSVTRARTKSINSSSTQTYTEYTLPVDASWEPDFWGSIRNTFLASKYAAQASIADLENTRLTVQTDLAVDYFTIREIDSQKSLLDSTVKAYRDSLQLTRVLNKTGIDSDQDVAQAETQLDTTEAQSTDLAIQRAQTEHAIAVLLGQPASTFAIKTNLLAANPPAVPFGVPSQLLERRPDIAAAERSVAQANAQIGVARAAYFPTITLTGSAGYQNTSAANLISGPSFIWSVGGTLAETIFDAGRRQAVTEQAWANYRSTVATYRETVLAAFQAVEDDLAALRILSKELDQQSAAVAASQRYLNLAVARYKLGVDSYLNVITAQTTLLGNQRTGLTLQMEQMTDSVQLINALGGGWDAKYAATAPTTQTTSQTAHNEITQ
jgi:NodT family efflux transporter outer membrane factor (OMF) lipoprotein